MAFFKKLFSEKEEERPPEKPGRIFNKVLTGRYFGCEEDIHDEERIAAAKREKVKLIEEMELLPKFKRSLTVTYDTPLKDPAKRAEEGQAVHLVFQKESMHNSMVHITELSFIVKGCDLEEFEEMSGISLENDFRDLTNFVYEGEERRKKDREALSEHL